MIFAPSDFVNVCRLHRTVGGDCHFGVDPKEAFPLASLIMRDSDLFPGDQNRVRLLVFGFSQLLTLRKCRFHGCRFEVLTVQSALFFRDFVRVL